MYYSSPGYGYCTTEFTDPSAASAVVRLDNG